MAGVAAARHPFTTKQSLPNPARVSEVTTEITSTAPAAVTIGSGPARNGVGPVKLLFFAAAGVSGATQGNESYGMGNLTGPFAGSNSEPEANHSFIGLDRNASDGNATAYEPPSTTLNFTDAVDTFDNGTVFHFEDDGNETLSNETLSSGTVGNSTQVEKEKPDNSGREIMIGMMFGVCHIVALAICMAKSDCCCCCCCEPRRDAYAPASTQMAAVPSAADNV
jgi:hypothetical protein